MRSLTPGQRHAWALVLDEGDYVVVEVEQRGVDLVVRALSPSGEREGEFDWTGASGAETARWIASAAGEWTVEIAPFEGTSAGEYTIELVTHRVATDRDHALMARDRHLAQADSLSELAVSRFRQGQYAETTPLLERALEIRESALGPDHLDVATSLNNLAQLYRSEGRYGEAAPLYERALEIRKSALGPNHPDVAQSLNNLAVLYGLQGRYGEAEPLYERALEIRESLLGPDHLDVALTLNNLALLYDSQGRYGDAEPLYERSLEIREVALGPDHPDVATSLNNLAMLYRLQGRFEEAEPLYERALEIRKSVLRPNHPDVAQSLNNLAGLYYSQGRYGDAESLYENSLEIFESVLGPDHPDVAVSLNNLAALYDSQGRYGDAEPLYERSLEIREVALGADHPDVALGLNNLATLYDFQGRYGEAEPLHKRALEIWESALGPDHPDVALSLNNLASLYDSQGRYGEAESLYERALEIRESALGPAHPDVALSVNNLAVLYDSQGRYEAAEPLYERALEIWEVALGPDHPDVAVSLHNLAVLYDSQDRYEVAEPLYERAIEIRESALEPDHPLVAMTLNDLAGLYRSQGRFGEAKLLVERAVSILERTSGAPRARIAAYAQRARLRRQESDTVGALGDLQEALSAAEDLRPQVGGGEETRAGFFSRYDDSYDLMFGWQIESADLEAALEWSERGRARTLLDQLAAGQVDLRQSIPPDVRDGLEARERDINAKRAEYQQRITLLRSRGDLSEAVRIERIEALEDTLREADEAFHQVYREIKNASPLWRGLLTRSGAPVSLSEIQRELVPSGGLVLVYSVGEESSYLLAIPSRGEEPGAWTLEVDSAAAAALELEPGPLTEEALANVFAPEGDEPGLLELAGLGSRSSRRMSARRGRGDGALHALWRVLVPDDLRNRALAASEVVLIPDGWLHQLPFEALVVEPRSEDADSPRYWLDEGPAIRYAPSATVLANLEDRPRVRLTSRTTALLSLSDPIYDPAELAGIVAAAEGTPGDVSSSVAAVGETRRTAYERGAGPLDRLPGTARETETILEAFGADRALGEVTVLQRAEAREPALRETVVGKRYLHLATHGLVDERRGDLFAALALTPPPPGERASVEDDGFLQLHEIYDLPLEEVELAVLSACETNVGTRLVGGEGVFALSRGFMAAGARRVIASQWAVDDASTADLMGRFFGTIAEQEQSGRGVDYAGALRDAKLAVRNDPATADPYYWAPFILAGKR